MSGAAQLRSAVEAFTLMQGDDETPIRWFEFDEGRTIAWRVHSGGQPGLGLDASVAAFNVALQAWNDDRGSNIRYTYAGTTTAAAGFDRGDDVNTILFEDPGDANSKGSFDCESGGVIAVGGPWFYESTRAYRGRSYHPAAEAEIVTNDGTACFFAGKPRAAEEVFAHELGHTLGLGHSSTRDALMYSRAHDDNRGARLHADDQAAVAEVYGTVGSGRPVPRGPKAPNRLTVSPVEATAVILKWKDNAKNETGFRLELKVGRGRYREIQTLPANTIQVMVGDLAPGVTYSFRVRAFNDAGVSAYTNVVKVRTPGAGG